MKLASLIIMFANLCNVINTAIIFFCSIDRTGTAIVALILIVIFMVGNEIVLWKYTFYYWVTSLNLETMFHNRRVMYNDRISMEDMMTMRRPNNINTTMVKLVDFVCKAMIAGTFTTFIVASIVFYEREDESKESSEQRYINDYIGSIQALELLTVGLFCTRLYVAFFMVLALRGIYKAYKKEQEDYGSMVSSESGP